MILIITSSFEISTHYVIDWLNFYKKEFVVCSVDNPIVDICVYFTDIDNSYVVFRNKIKIYYKDISSYWYRRGDFIFEESNNYGSRYYFNKNRLEAFYMEESRILNYFLNYIFENKPTIGNYNISLDTNKLVILDKAKKIGLNIPDTILCCSRRFIKNNTLTKPISEAFTSTKNGFFTHIRTAKSNNFNKLPERFFPSLIQNRIEKKFEIRTFYFKSQFFSMAIFDESNLDNNVDVRFYQQQKPVLYVPIKLPNSVEYKLKKLMKNLNLNTGSIDLIYSIDKKYYFLEVNPAGQFSMVSEPCNYNLERIIAENL